MEKQLTFDSRWPYGLNSQCDENVIHQNTVDDLRNVMGSLSVKIHYTAVQSLERQYL